jgi:hypothetical protein
MPTDQHQHVVAEFEIVTSEAKKSTEDEAENALHSPPLTKFGIESVILIRRPREAKTSGYWYEAGKFWKPPHRMMPSDRGPHVVSAFRPDIFQDVPNARHLRVTGVSQ